MAVNVKDANRLPKLADQLAYFFRTIEPDVGPFDVELAVCVNPAAGEAIGPVSVYPRHEIVMTLETDEEGGDEISHT
jgi:hypothetical protein